MKAIKINNLQSTKSLIFNPAGLPDAIVTHYRVNAEKDIMLRQLDERVFSVFKGEKFILEYLKKIIIEFG